MTILVRVLAPAAVAAGVVVCAPGTASADAVDDAFLAYLGEQGVSVADSAFAADTAQNICDYIDDGNNYVDILTELSAYPDQLSLDSLPTFTAAAVGSYCPRNLFVLP